MEEEKKGFVGIKNWIGKIFLMLLGAVWLVSDLYDNIMSNFFLTDRIVKEWGTIGDYGVLLSASGLVLGGVYLNTLFEVLKNKFSK